MQKLKSKITTISLLIFSAMIIGVTIQNHYDYDFDLKNLKKVVINIPRSQMHQLTSFTTMSLDTATWKNHSSNYLFETEYEFGFETEKIIKRINFKYPQELKIYDYGEENGTLWLSNSSTKDVESPITIQFGKYNLRNGIEPNNFEGRIETVQHDEYVVTKITKENAIAYFFNYKDLMFERDITMQLTFLDENLSSEEKEAAEKVTDEIVKSFRFTGNISGTENDQDHEHELEETEHADDSE